MHAKSNSNLKRDEGTQVQVGQGRLKGNGHQKVLTKVIIITTKLWFWFWFWFLKTKLIISCDK
jgi:hypothetical protein